MPGPPLVEQEPNLILFLSFLQELSLCYVLSFHCILSFHSVNSWVLCYLWLWKKKKKRSKKVCGWLVWEDLCFGKKLKDYLKVFPTLFNHFYEHQSLLFWSDFVKKREKNWKHSIRFEITKTKAAFFWGLRSYRPIAYISAFKKYG